VAILDGAPDAPQILPEALQGRFRRRACVRPWQAISWPLAAISRTRGSWHFATHPSAKKVARRSLSSKRSSRRRAESATREGCASQRLRSIRSSKFATWKLASRGDRAGVAARSRPCATARRLPAVASVLFLPIPGARTTGCSMRCSRAWRRQWRTWRGVSKHSAGSELGSGRDAAVHVPDSPPSTTAGSWRRRRSRSPARERIAWRSSLSRPATQAPSAANGRQIPICVK